MNKKYSDKFKDPRWQKKRLDILNRDEWTCQICFDTENTLHVHHRYYLKGKDPWDYDNNVLVTLCEDCHNTEHQDMAVAIETLSNAIMMAGYTSGDIFNIALGFAEHKPPHAHDVSAEVIGYAMSNKDVMEKLTEQYFEHIRSRKNRDK